MQQIEQTPFPIPGPTSVAQVQSTNPNPAVAKRSFNILSIVAFVIALPFFGGVLISQIIGIIALVQINKSHERGKLLAWAAIILGTAETVLGVMLLWGAK